MYLSNYTFFSHLVLTLTLCSNYPSVSSPYSRSPALRQGRSLEVSDGHTASKRSPSPLSMRHDASPEPASVQGSKISPLLSPPLDNTEQTLADGEGLCYTLIHDYVGTDSCISQPYHSLTTMRYHHALNVSDSL